MSIRLIVSSVLAAAAFSSLSAQTNTGSIGGMVKDASATTRLIRRGGLK